MPEEPHLNDDKSPLIDLLSCFVCKETMKIEKSVPDFEGWISSSIVANAAEESSRCDFSAEVGMRRAEGEEIRMPKKISRRGWPMKHDRELIMLAKTHTAQAIAEKFDRPITTILKRAEKLGLSIRRKAKGK